MGVGDQMWVWSLNFFMHIAYHNLPSKCNNIIVHVMYMQDDIIMGTLTVRENFHFSAALCLSLHMTFKQRKERVESIIDELGLTKCANTKVRTSPEALSIIM